MRTINIKIIDEDDVKLMQFTVLDDPSAREPDVEAPEPDVAAVQPVSHDIRANVNFRSSCDECGINPIPGVRYKSNVRKNYDLCEFCFLARQQP